MSDRRHPMPTIPVVTPPIGNDMGPARDRGVKIRRSILTTDTTAIRIVGNPGAWIEFAGVFRDFEFSPWSNEGPWIEFDPGDLYPFPADGIVWVRAQSGAAGSVVAREWTFAEGLMRASNRSVVRAVATTPAGTPTAPTSMNAANRQALTTATPGTYTMAAGTIFAIVKAAAANANAAYIGTTSATVNVAGTRFELMQSDFVTVYAPSFGFLGTTGEFLYVLEFA